MKIYNIQPKINAGIYAASNINNSHKKYPDNQPKYTLASKPDSISFGMRIDYGTPAELAEQLQKKIINIHENIDLIQSFFDKYTSKNSQLGALIKKEYKDLIPKRQSGIVFKLPDTENTIEVMRSQTRKNVLYISIDKGDVEYNGIVVDGNDKLIANYLKKHPHMLPRGIKYMDEKRMAEAEPEKFITLADEKLQNYSDYIRKLQSGELPMPKLNTSANSVSEEKKTINRISKPRHKKTEKKPAKPVVEVFEERINRKINTCVKKISELFSADRNNFPQHITPKTASNGNILGFHLITDDGGTLIVTKKVVSSYGNAMPYLSFEKVNKDNSLNFISIDLITNKVLRTKDRGKPHISNDNIVYELTPAEIERRKIEQKLDYYMEQIFKQQKKDAENIAQPEYSKSVVKETLSEQTQPKETLPKETDEIIENLNQNMRERGQKDGNAAANEYFEAFKAEFLKTIQEKMKDFNANIRSFFESLS